MGNVGLKELTDAASGSDSEADLLRTLVDVGGCVISATCRLTWQLKETLHNALD